MVPTLFGVTLVSFAVMQMAPGDPLLLQSGGQGSLTQQGETREAYLVRRRDLKLDKPLFLNFRYFQDWTDEVRHAAWWLGTPQQQLPQELRRLGQADDPQSRARLRFLRKLDVPQFRRRLRRFAGPGADLRDEQTRAGLEALARAVGNHVQVFCENLGAHGVPVVMSLLEQAQDRPMRLGLLRALRFMVVEPFQFTFSRPPRPEEAPLVEALWRRWWELNRKRFPPLDPDRQTVLRRQLEQLVQAPDDSTRFDLLQQEFLFDASEMGFFVQRLLAPESTLEEKAICALVLKLYVARPLKLEVTENSSEEEIQQVVANWKLHYELYRGRYEPGTGQRLLYLFTDTQYAHMVYRLFTFDFGRSTLRTREPVSEKIWNAFVVSAPLMALSQVLIYLISVPIGVVCAVKHNTWVDRALSLLLFVLYSIPAYVAGMLLLLFFCYGDYLKWFPSSGLHSDGAEKLDPLAYWLDYAWHIVLPTLCLTLFSLAALAMYSRTSMLEVLGQDYIRTARAKGLSQPKVILKHALRNALIPIITLFSNTIPAVLGGSVLIEYLFNIPGMGRLTFESIENKDYPTLMALVYINAIVVMVSILASDILYVLVDPRISFQGRSQGG